jgi:uncharacterized protein YndB with AHSA1/START domain
MDSIEREIVIAAPVERVWQIITQAPHIAGWFSETAEVDLRIGGRMVLAWKEHGTYLATVERLEPPTVFAFRGAYRPDTEPGPGNSTVVEFTLTPEDERTRLRVVESGFSTLDMSTEEQDKLRSGNVEGWRIEMDGLLAYAERE